MEHSFLRTDEEEQPANLLLVPEQNRSRPGIKATKKLVQLLESQVVRRDRQNSPTAPGNDDEDVNNQNTKEVRHLPGLSLSMLSLSEIFAVCFMAWKSFTLGRANQNPPTASLASFAFAAIDVTDSTTTTMGTTRDAERTDRKLLLRKMKIASTSRVVADLFSAPKMQRKAAALILGVFFHRQQRRLRLAFLDWMQAASSLRRLMQRLFRRWSHKTSAYKLSRLNAARMLETLLPLNEATPRCQLELGFGLWLEGVAFKRAMVHMRLLFVCWRTAVRALKAGRKRLVKLLFVEWRAEVKWEMGLARRHYLLLGMRGLLELQSRRKFVRGVSCWKERLPLRQAFWTWLATSSSAVLQLRAKELSRRVLFGDSSMVSSGATSPAASPRRSTSGLSLRESAASANANVNVNVNVSVSGSLATSASPRHGLSASLLRRSASFYKGDAGSSTTQQQQQTPRPRRPSALASPSPARAAWNSAMLNITNLPQTQGRQQKEGPAYHDLPQPPSTPVANTSRITLASGGGTPAGAGPSGYLSNRRMAGPSRSVLSSSRDNNEKGNSKLDSTRQPAAPAVPARAPQPSRYASTSASNTSTATDSLASTRQKSRSKPPAAPAITAKATILQPSRPSTRPPAPSPSPSASALASAAASGPVSSNKRELLSNPAERFKLRLAGLSELAGIAIAPSPSR